MQAVTHGNGSLNSLSRVTACDAGPTSKHANKAVAEGAVLEVVLLNIAFRDDTSTDRVEAVGVQVRSHGRVANISTIGWLGFGAARDWAEDASCVRLGGWHTAIKRVARHGRSLGDRWPLGGWHGSGGILARSLRI